MDAFEVPRSQWREFLQRISSRERGAEVTLELRRRARDPQARAETPVRRRPLGLLEVDPHGALHIEVEAPHWEMLVVRPTTLEFAPHGEDVPAILCAETEEGTRLVVRFERPLVPGLGDALP